MLEREVGVEAISLELADPDSVTACAAEALRRTSCKLFALFNNAAYGQLGAVEDLSADLLRRQLEVNVLGTHELNRPIVAAMRKQGEGRLVMCSSVLGLAAAPHRGAYCASKFALEALSDSLRLELRGTGLRVSIIEPGPIRTRFVEAALANFRKTIDIDNSPHRDTYRARLTALEAGGQSTFKLEPEAVARKLVHAVESRHPKARYYVTVPTYLAAAAKRLLPVAVTDWLAARQ
jgi:NAD(P)-dependent dehydrogenase (short-subunit alcohol dehydrogenase family)